jgi:hypothetical protein
MNAVGPVGKSSFSSMVVATETSDTEPSKTPNSLQAFQMSHKSINEKNSMIVDYDLIIPKLTTELLGNISAQNFKDFVIVLKLGGSQNQRPAGIPNNNRKILLDRDFFEILKYFDIMDSNDLLDSGSPATIPNSQDKILFTYKWQFLGYIPLKNSDPDGSSFVSMISKL